MSSISSIQTTSTSFQKIPLDKTNKEENTPEFQRKQKGPLTKDEKKFINTQAGYVASQFDVQQNPKIYARNLLTAGTIIATVSHLSKRLMTGNLYSNLDDSVTIEDVIKSTPLYKAGDSFNKKSPHLNKFTDTLKEGKKSLKNTISKNETLKKVSDCYKDGSLVTWSMGKIYEEGKKGYETYDDMIQHLQIAKFKDKNVQAKVDDVLERLSKEKITSVQAGKEIVKSGILDKVSANELKSISANQPTGLNKAANKLFAIENNLAHSYVRAKFFNGQNKEIGKTSNFLNKAYLMITDTLGGGSFGGGLLAITMGIFGCVTAIHAVSKTKLALQEKKKRVQEELDKGTITKEEAKKMLKQPWCGDKFSAFAEDMFGFTIGSCLVLYPLARIVNKSLGFSNLGRDFKAVQNAAKELGVNGNDKLYQRTVIKYNKSLSDSKLATNCKRMIDGKYTLMEKIKNCISTNPLEKNIAKLGIEITENTSSEELKKILDSKIISQELASSQRELIKNAGKSKLTIGSIFKPNEVNNGSSVIKRLGRYVVHKPLELGAKIISPDKFLMYKHDSSIGNKLFNAFAKIVDVGGGIGRIALVGFGLSAPCRNVLMKISHKIFGKPTFSQYDETIGEYKQENIEEKKKRMSAMKNPTFTIPESYKEITKNKQS